MKKIKLTGIALIAFLLSSCNKDTVTDYSEWRIENQTYFQNMKDSTGFVFDSVLTNYGYFGYYYRILTKGDSASISPAYNDIVEVNYQGSTIDGFVFDKTYSGSSSLNDSTATPVTFYTNKLILGWTVNLMKMKKGEVRTIVLPYVLAYGAGGAGSAIPPYSTLRFDIHLVKVF